ncbi:anti-sigma factor [Radiobacillus kanasensis]|uniref:anti sigma factor C-terminal domain-containing protein n=1 Tax=Radiobacillus kanasensis TaxID=2844358 RepID=UPI001E561ABB|nr:anti sigma factor C-terminal domain-containing protein [Radiobacillus kanasensis]UFT99334.1 anti-sigma factor [Radiobacillus kanasensis]
MSKENEFIPKDLEFEKLMKKAKRRSLIKMVLISLVISLVVLTGLYFIGDTVMKMKMEKEINLDLSWNGIVGANVEEQGTTYNYSPISATAKTKLVKKVGGVPIPWGEEEKVFTILGTSRLITNDGPSGSGSISDERIPLYYQGERVMEFYHPEVTYKEVFDDRELLNHIDEHSVVEMAFSFDKGYTIEEVNSIFKEHIAWYWVDTFSKEDIDEHNELNGDDQFTRGHTVNGFEAYGFPYNTHPKAMPASNFISILQMMKSDGGSYQNEANKIYNNITKNGKVKLEPKNLNIIGVVVTGKPSDLKKYNDASVIRAATLGATTNQY